MRETLGADDAAEQAHSFPHSWRTETTPAGGDGIAEKRLTDSHLGNKGQPSLPAHVADPRTPNHSTIKNIGDGRLGGSAS